MSNHSFNDALLNNNNNNNNSIPMEEAEPGKVAVDASIEDETLIQMMMNGDFKFEEELKTLHPSFSSSSTMFPCIEVGESSSSQTIHLTPPDLEKKTHNLNDDDDQVGFRTPNKAIVNVENTSSESQQRKRRRRKLDLVLTEDNEKRPDWLPSDWLIEHRLREGGATAGLTDRYYYEPVSHRQYRSRKEVLNYLETGTRRKYKGKSQDKSNTAANVMPSISTGQSEQKGCSPEKRKRSGLNFDFDNPPKKVTWVLNSFPEAPGSWTSFISGEMVPGHTRQEWDAAFTYHVHGVMASSSKVDEVGVNLEAGA